MEVLLVLASIAAAIVAVVLYQNKKAHKRLQAERERLLAKYGDEEIVNKIMRKLIWQGMSEEQLIESWGYPAAKDQKIYKTKITETFKYNQVGKNRFASRVRVENGFVVGWDQK